MKKNYHTISFAEKTKLYEKMKNIITVEDGFSAYTGSWSDISAAKAFGIASHKIVARLRREMFGPARTAYRAARKSDSEVMRAIAALTYQIGQLNDRVTNLETGLGVQAVNTTQLTNGGNSGYGTMDREVRRTA